MSKKVFKGGGGRAKVVLENAHKKTIWNYRPDGTKKVVVVQKPQPYYAPPRPQVIIQERPHILETILAAQTIGAAFDNHFEERRLREREQRLSQREYQLALKEKELEIREVLEKAFAAERRAEEILKRAEEKLATAQS